MEIALATLSDIDLVVVDASALVELVVLGRHRTGADALLDRYRNSPRLTLVSAAHGLIEGISALRRLVQRGDIGSDDGAAAVTWLSDLDLVLDATAPRARRVWSLRDRMTAYDAAYAAAAEAFGAPLLSVDSKLLAACADADVPAIHLDDVARAS